MSLHAEKEEWKVPLPREKAVETGMLPMRAKAEILCH